MQGHAEMFLWAFSKDMQTNKHLLAEDLKPSETHKGLCVLFQSQKKSQMKEKTGLIYDVKKVKELKQD